MLENTYKQLTCQQFRIEEFIQHNYNKYTFEQIVVLDGLKMQTSWQFVYQIFKNFDYLNLPMLTDYGNEPFDGHKTYNKDQINDYLREIGIYYEQKKLNGLLVLIKNSNYILCKEYNQYYVADQFNTTIKECAEDGIKLDIYCFSEYEIGVDKLWQ